MQVQTRKQEQGTKGKEWLRKWRRAIQHLWHKGEGKLVEVKGQKGSGQERREGEDQKKLPEIPENAIVKLNTWYAN